MIPYRGFVNHLCRSCHVSGYTAKQYTHVPAATTQTIQSEGGHMLIGGVCEMEEVL